MFKFSGIPFQLYLTIMKRKIYRPTLNFLCGTKIDNLKAVKNLLSGCPVTVSLSRSVTETPQEVPKVIGSQPSDVFDLGFDLGWLPAQHSHNDEFLSWLTGGEGSQCLPPTTKEGRVGVVQYESIDLNDDSATLTAESEEENVDSIKVDSSYTASADVHADNWKSDT